MTRILELGRLLLVGTTNARAMALLLAHLLWSRRAFDPGFLTLLCWFVGASRRLASPEPPRHCYLHEIMNALWRGLGLREPEAFVAELGRVIDYLYQRNVLAFSGLMWSWEGADVSRCPTYLARVVAQGYVYFDPAHKLWQKERVYTRYTLSI